MYYITTSTFYLMSVEENLINRILSARSAGIKKTDLRDENSEILILH